jgi:hypothetical protein
MGLEPLLQAIADFLDDQNEMIERVRRDLVRGLKKPGSGRRGLAWPPCPSIMIRLTTVRASTSAAM